MKVTIVTGGTRGIGRSIVEKLAQEGWVVYFCARNREKISDLEGILEEYKVKGYVCDVRNWEEVDSFVDKVLKAEGKIDLLVNNAGIGVRGEIDEISLDDWHSVIETNLTGVFHFIKKVAPYMKERRKGMIINIGSLASKNVFPGGSVYCASKFGLLGLSEAAMLDLRPYGIKVATVLPGSVATDFFRSGGDQSWKIRPQDIAEAVWYIVNSSDRALPSRIEIRPLQIKS